LGKILSALIFQLRPLRIRQITGIHNQTLSVHSHPEYGSLDSGYLVFKQVLREAFCGAGAVLLFRGFGLANVAQEARMSGAARGIMLASLKQAQVAVDGQTDIFGVAIFLTIVFPPADRAQRKCAWRLKRLESAAWAAITNSDGIFHSSHWRPWKSWTKTAACRFTQNAVFSRKPTAFYGVDLVCWITVGIAGEK